MVTLLANAAQTLPASMPEFQSLSRQQKIGGAIGLVVLAFALGYRFFPLAMVTGPVQHRAQASGRAASPSVPMGFDQRVGKPGMPGYTEAHFGPPVSLASSEVISHYRRTANAPVNEQLADWLQHGDAAAAAGKLAGSGASAASWYAKVLRSDSDNRAARAGLAEVARRLASAAGDAVADGDRKKAEQVLQTLREVPLADASVARVEKQLEVFDKVSPMLAQAADLLHGEDVSAARRDKALDLYHKILALDPDNGVAQQGLLKVQRFWLDKTLTAVAKNDYRGAEKTLHAAADIAPASHQLQNVRSRVEGMRRMRATGLLVQAHTALDSGDLGLARTLADQALSVSPDVPGMEQFDKQYRNARLYAGHKPGQTFVDRFTDRAGQAPSMVVLPVGSFMMGSAKSAQGTRANEWPRHKVDITHAIAMARTETSVGQFRQFIQATGYQTEADRQGSARVYDRASGRMRDARGADWQRNYRGAEASDDEPVVNVSWTDAVAYARWLSAHTGHTYRLPSEAEFEYALRAGTSTRYWWGDGVPDEAVENLTGSGDRSKTGRKWLHAFQGYRDGFWGTAPVASFQPNPFGLYDMDGNVSEWVADCWHDNYTRAPDDGAAWVNPGCNKRVVRGGSWGSAPEQVRSAFRLSAAATVRNGRLGFRVVRDLGAPPSEQSQDQR